MRAAALARATAAAFLLLMVPSRVGAELPSLEVMFHRHKPQLESLTMATAGDGPQFAYVVTYRPPEFDQARSDRSLFLEDGTPVNAVGSSVFALDASGDSVVRVCPGRGDVWDPSWSPDGRRLAVYANGGGHPALWVHDRSTGECRRQTDARIAPKLWPGGAALWSPDGRRVYVPLAPLAAGQDQGGQLRQEPDRPGRSSAADVEVHCSPACPAQSSRVDPSAGPGFQLNLNHSRIGAVDLHTGETTLMVDAAPPVSVAQLSPSGQWLSLLSVPRQPDINTQALVFDLLVNRTDGSGPPIVLARDLPRPPTDYYREVYRWSPRTDVLLYAVGGSVWLVDMRASQPRARRVGSPGVLYAAHGHRFVADGDGMILALANDPGGQPESAAFHQVESSGAVVAAYGFDSNRWTFESLITGASGAARQTAPRTLLLQLRDAATGDLAVVRLSAGGGEEVIWRGSAQFSSLTPIPGTDQWVAFYQDFGTPPDLYRFSADLRARTRLTIVEPGLETLQPARIRTYLTQVPVGGGRFRQVRTAIILPAAMEEGDGPAAVVTVYPGLRVSRLTARFGGGEGVDGIPPVLYAERGYAVVLPEIPIGPGDEPGNIIDEMRDVLLPQLYHAHHLGLIDITRLAVRGNSFGGFAAAGLASATDLFAAVSVGNGPYNLSGPNYSGELDAAGIAWTETDQPRLGTHPWANLRRYVENSPYYRADRITAPVLILQGGSDSYLQESRMLFVALRRLERPARLAIYANSGHWISSWPLHNALDAFERLISFLDQHLGVRPGTPVEAIW